MDDVLELRRIVEYQDSSDRNQSVLKIEPPLDCEIIPNKKVQTDQRDVSITEKNNITEEIEDLRNLITNNIVEKVLKKDYGQKAILLEFKVIDFAKPGVNYTTFVTGVQCKAMLNENTFNTSYIVKLNNSWKIPGGDDLIAEFFLREGKFLTEVKSCLNSILTSLGEDNLYLPECLYESYERGKEILFMKDLRERSFKMFDRLVGMNVEHATIVVKALARLHASGFIYKEQNKEKSLMSKFPYLTDAWMNNPDPEEPIIKMFIGLIFNGASLLENMQGYEKAREWLLKHEEDMADVFMDIVYSGDEKFVTICHGDIANNNIVFRYNNQNRPAEAILLDLQMSRVSSIATDLHYFLNTSMDGEERSKHLEGILHSYYETMEGIIRKAQIPIPFTFLQLKEEMDRKQIYGMIAVLLILPLIIKEEADTFEMNNISEEDMDEKMAEDRKRSVLIMERNPTFKSRILPVFDDCNRLGVFEKDYN